MVKDIKDFVVILDAGHGGWDGNQYATYPNKCYRHNQNIVVSGKTFEFHHKGWFFEGHFNRIITQKMVEMFKALGVTVAVISDKYSDVSLGRRITRTNAVADKHTHAIFISNHANASLSGKARGFEIYTSPGQKNSDAVANDIFKLVKTAFGKEIVNYRTDRRDGDDDKESNFAVLKCKCPAILIEWLFFDNYHDAFLLCQDDVQYRMAKAAVVGVCNYAQKLGYLVPGAETTPEDEAKETDPVEETPPAISKP